MIECSMDGAPSMMGKNIGLLGILLREYLHIKINHCIIHCQSLASIDLSPNFSDVMQVVISTVNYVKARDQNSCMFKQLYITENSNHHTLLMHTVVRWLSQGKTLERVFLLHHELATFLQDKRLKNARYFHDSHFLAHLALLKNIQFHILNDLSIDVIVSERIFKEYLSVTFNFDGTRPALSLSSLSQMHVYFSTTFRHLSRDCMPIADKS